MTGDLSTAAPTHHGPAAPLCPACGGVNHPGAEFCRHCGTAIVPPPGAALAPAPSRSRPVSAPGVHGAVGPVAKVENRLAGALAVGAGIVGALACSLTWIRIEVEGRTGPGSSASGLEGRDGRTVLAACLVAAVAGLVLLVGRSDGWLKVAVVAAGGVTSVIAAVDIAEAGAKAGNLETRFGIRPGVVSAEAGSGLWLVGLAGTVLLAAGLLARRPP